MLIKECHGYHLEKTFPNTFEDSFNRSEVTFIENDKEKTLHVLYLRYYDDIVQEITTFEGDTLFTIGSREVTFKDVVAFVCLMKNPELRSRKRLYINEKKELAQYFKAVQLETLAEIFQQLEKDNTYHLKNQIHLSK